MCGWTVRTGAQNLRLFAAEKSECLENASDGVDFGEAAQGIHWPFAGNVIRCARLENCAGYLRFDYDADVA